MHRCHGTNLLSGIWSSHHHFGFPLRVLINPRELGNHHPSPWENKAWLNTTSLDQQWGKKLGEIPSLLMKSPSFPMDVLFLSFPVCFPSPSISPVFPWIFALKLMGFSMPSTTVTAGPYSWPRHCVRTAGKPTPPRSGTPRRTEI